MRIIHGYGNTQGGAINGAQQGAATRSGKDSANDKSSAVSGSPEKVTLSPEARRLADASAASDASKVSSLRAAIQGGSFKIDHAAIAAKIVDGE
jgi:flagellar biosynthesis anti-sigma factor FlgM